MPRMPPLSSLARSEPLVLNAKVLAAGNQTPVSRSPVLVIAGAAADPAAKLAMPVTARVEESVAAPVIVVAGVMVTAPVDTLPIPIVPVPLALSVRASLEPELLTDRATPPAAAADLTFSPVADEAVDASTLKAGLVAPFNPTARAFPELLVMATAPPNVTAPAMFAVVPTNNALAIPTPPLVMMEPVPTEVLSVVSVEDIPAMNGMREVVVV